MTLPALLKTPALAPHELSAVAEQAVADLMREGESANTQRSYQGALRYWAAWYAMRYGQPMALPLPAACVLQFIVDHAQRIGPKGLVHELPPEIDQALVNAGFKGKVGPLANNTLVHRVAVLSKAHQVKELKNPCRDPKVRELLSRTRKAYAKRGELPQKKDALTKDPLKLILATCDDSLRGKRDRALLLFAWASGGRRRSEVAAADMKFLKKLRPGEFSYELVHSKTNQSGADRPENHKPVLGAAGAALQDWLAESQIREGALFRRVLKGNNLGAALSAASVRDIVNKRCRLAGIEGTYSAHSLRSGFVTEAVLQQVSAWLAPS
ncbi:tyrosine-type recombinase/integrase [Hydrogenophaga sp. YM1]|uniref:tyrosine-type recombinase/integrase n=1 Tax=Hydrogenophaga sp. YM1 TaxID=2806262 RepID=UPI0019595397|nr:tyrosine-type recombinase/integrase [Hydrogenophaga sp. YM1]QRR32474.1 tyrosine-type recombinase/integrase [Hydrogenophaga sp. YM1]